MTLQGVEGAVQNSGGILYFMALLLLIELTVILERGWYLTRILGQGKQVLKEVNKVDKVSISAFQAVVDHHPDLPHGKILEAAIQHDLTHDFDRISDKLEESIMCEVPHVDRFLWVLDTIVTLAPLMGLLGTIIGMFNAFQVLGDAGNSPTKVTGGVAEALLATACGLFIAIIGLVALNGLNNRVRVVMHQFETLKMMLLNRLYPHYHESLEEQKRVLTEMRVRVAA